MLCRYADVDVALEPFPFSAGLTSCEALWMGVPVVTASSSRPVSRQTHAILQAIGRPQRPVKDEEAYIRVALELARDADELDRIRRELPEQMRASPLCDGKSFSRDLDSLYREIWKAYLDER